MLSSWLKTAFTALSLPANESMAESGNIAQRLQATVAETTADAPIRLNNPEDVYFVERGFLDIFAVETDAGLPAGPRLFIARLQEGKLAFGGPEHEARSREDASGAFALIAVPSPGADILKGKRSAFASAQDFDLEAIVWIDHWTYCLSQFLVRDSSPPPGDAHQLEALPGVSCSAGTALTAQHLDVIWVQSDQPMRMLGGSRQIEPGSPLLPMIEHTWVTLEADAEVSAFYTPSALVNEQLWSGFDAFMRFVRQHAADVWRRNALLAEDRHKTAAAALKAGRLKIFGTLAETLGVRRPPGLQEQAGRAPLQVAASMVADSAGVKLKIPRQVQPLKNPLDALLALARQSGVYTRQLRLVPGWWRHQGPSFVSVLENDQPVAVLATRQGYEAVNPATGARFPVDAGNASGIAAWGMMFYSPLPDHVQTGAKALGHVMRGQGRSFFVVFAMAIVGALFALLTPVATGQLLAHAIPRVDTSMWAAYLAALLTSSLAIAAFGIIRGLAVLQIQTQTDERLQAAVWIRLLSLPARFFRQYSTGDLADRANGISTIRQLLTGVIANSIIGSLAAVFSLILLFWYSWQLALYACLLVSALIGGSWLFALAQMPHQRNAFRMQGALDGLVFQIITGLAKLRIANTEIHALARWAELYAKQKSETLAAHRWAAGQFAFNGLFEPLAMLTVFAGIQYVFFATGNHGRFGLADFLSFNAAFGQFIAAMASLTSASTTVVAILPLFERIHPIMKAEPEVAESGLIPADITGDIEFSKVSFRYQPETPNALDDVSFRIRAGEYVAFVGPSGSGKSTLYRLLIGFERPDSGSIFLDGSDLASLNMAVVRGRMGVVLQDGHLSAASIFRNIAGETSLTLEEAWDAVRAAGLEEDIKAMPMQMHTVLAEGAVALSGGQKQRLLIARALARKSRVLLLDEATSALDNRTQETVQAALRSLKATRVVIAHRLSSVQHADRIYVLERGKIIESGAYDEMLAGNGAFARLARNQMLS